MVFSQNTCYNIFTEKKGGFVMNIPELSTAMANMEIGTKIGTAVLSKALDNTEALGESLIQMMDRSMELSVNPNVGSNFDMFV